TNLADAFESRRIVEIEIVRKAALNATPEDLDDLKGMVAAHEKIQSDPVGFRILDSRFHARLSAAAGNVVLERIAYGLYNMGLDIRRRATESLSLIKQSTEDHIRIEQAIAARDPDRAARQMGIHLDHIEETTRRAMEAEMSALARAARTQIRVIPRPRRSTGS
ncbi:MAG: FadR/GntR family transcriptional regulator, partial [Dongiaceae bacterium]